VRPLFVVKTEVAVDGPPGFGHGASRYISRCPAGFPMNTKLLPVLMHESQIRLHDVESEPRCLRLTIKRKEFGQPLEHFGVIFVGECSPGMNKTALQKR
jgi:hypothetical protein